MNIQRMIERFPDLSIGDGHFHGGLHHIHDNPGPHQHEVTIDGIGVDLGSYTGYVDGPGVRWSFDGNGSLRRVTSHRPSYERRIIRDGIDRRCEA